MAGKYSPQEKVLMKIPNVGPATARDLLSLGIEDVPTLAQQDPDELYHRLGTLKGQPQDPCVRDVFAAIISFAKGNPAQPWWAFTPERKKLS